MHDAVVSGFPRIYVGRHLSKARLTHRDRLQHSTALYRIGLFSTVLHRERGLWFRLPLVSTLRVLCNALRNAGAIKPPRKRSYSTNPARPAGHECCALTYCQISPTCPPQPGCILVLYYNSAPRSLQPICQDFSLPPVAVECASCLTNQILHPVPEPLSVPS
ncbi:hypothetical protein BCV70DRAFT_113669 [Testicularia cyperi]|uniref:Uncharacterized protein n=1 Tax=Testicularia cyperi TaxID=1882483 RepID=A0A317XNF6_9BASI|nr:hypothetical protein BCV70DRAFT_113669 [Testicularia cyperi]